MPFANTMHPPRLYLLFLNLQPPYNDQYLYNSQFPSSDNFPADTSHNWYNHLVQQWLILLFLLHYCRVLLLQQFHLPYKYCYSKSRMPYHQKHFHKRQCLNQPLQVLPYARPRKEKTQPQIQARSQHTLQSSSQDQEKYLLPAWF